MEDKSFNDVYVPSSAVIHDVLSVEVCKLSQCTNHLVFQAWKDLTHNGLVAAMDEGDIWVWNDGEKRGGTLPKVSGDDN